jgi:hypothetical protein
MTDYQVVMKENRLNLGVNAPNLGVNAPVIGSKCAENGSKCANLGVNALDMPKTTLIAASMALQKASRGRIC